ncbi:putative F-box-like domain superfamily protein [Helianthus annuus]|uniref:F-box-like domain superfamily protein n=1 Tax=Helianthus annuus TaxID=4232 RepID=A0A9K3IZS0_HELAN|nr:putative F-box-like domain superfamily protein [Helianthus annuus]KAJ0577049.1 putative F-box-like domain superfamily protein [Helianthus annuus]KAJ0584602.1 putative F-box-like domain superfamily protein [Helianthus annuus]KAJ0750269.1 putative F-box-like domain superfamily protein [Helianthus annuus]KAJ0918994.1 putative F-box-like domain superfamily protein [Helianthus annuus]
MFVTKAVRGCFNSFFNILVRLPKQPILRFRCLSKHWNRLLSDHFMKSRSRRMILLPTRPLHAIDYTNDGTINGIVLLVFIDDMILYNPFTIVPKQSLHPSHSSSNAYGFCYGTTPDDLKIVRLRVLDHIDYYRCDVFSLKNSGGPRNYLLGVRMRCSIIFSRSAVGVFCLKYTLIFFSRDAAAHPGQRVGPPLLKNGSWSAKLKKFVQWCSVSLYGTFVNGFLY